MYILNRVLRFEWDVTKATGNEAKHGVSFEQAITVWDDPEFMDVYDDAHSQSEHRIIRIGLSDIGVIVVIYTERNDLVFRIISARKASRKERKLYYETQRKNRL